MQYPVWMDPGYPDEDVEYVDEDVEYVDDDGEYADDDEAMDEELAELLKPEPMSFPDAYAAAGLKPVELHVPGHSDAFKVLGETKERRFPAKRVARSANALAQALKLVAKKKTG